VKHPIFKSTPAQLSPHEALRERQREALAAITRPEPVQVMPLDQVRLALASGDAEKIKQAGLMLIRLASN
jgi:hypothetical protein